MRVKRSFLVREGGFGQEAVVQHETANRGWGNGLGDRDVHLDFSRHSFSGFSLSRPRCQKKVHYELSISEI